MKRITTFAGTPIADLDNKELRNELLGALLDTDERYKEAYDALREYANEKIRGNDKFLIRHAEYTARQVRENEDTHLAKIDPNGEITLINPNGGLYKGQIRTILNTEAIVRHVAHGGRFMVSCKEGAVNRVATVLMHRTIYGSAIYGIKKHFHWYSRPITIKSQDTED